MMQKANNQIRIVANFSQHFDNTQGDLRCQYKGNYKEKYSAG
jgi:hypothetical protein